MSEQITCSRNSESGVTLTEMMVAISMVGFLALGTTTFLNRQAGTVNELKFAANMQHIASNIEGALGRADVIFTSSLLNTVGNSELRNCLTPKSSSSSKPCVVTSPELQVSLNIVLPIKDGRPMVPSNIRRHTIAGTKNKPTLYGLRGKKDCVRSGPGRDHDCEVEARAYFWATCPPNLNDVTQKIDSGSPPPPTPSRCDRAQTIHLRYQVIHNRGAEKKGLGVTRRQLPSIPDNRVFYYNGRKDKLSGFGAISTPVASIALPQDLSASCPENYTLVSIEEGEPVCECLRPYRELSGTTGLKICQANQAQCRAGERYRGVDANGNIQCIKVICKNTPFDFQKKTASCAIGGWIESIALTPVKIGEARLVCHSEPCVVGKNGGACDTKAWCRGRVKCCYDVDPNL